MIYLLLGEGYSRLAVATGDRKMRPNDKAYLRVSGADMNIERFFLRLVKICCPITAWPGELRVFYLVDVLRHCCSLQGSTVLWFR